MVCYPNQPDLWNKGASVEGRLPSCLSSLMVVNVFIEDRLSSIWCLFEMDALAMRLKHLCYQKKTHLSVLHYTYLPGSDNAGVNKPTVLPVL